MSPVRTIDVGDHVECDSCGKDFTNSEESGGILFGSKGYGPCCAARMERLAKKYGEEHFIRDVCPLGVSFKAWCLKLRGGDNTIRVYT